MGKSQHRQLVEIVVDRELSVALSNALMREGFVGKKLAMLL